MEILSQKGIQATQSSVSRDLAALGVLRVNGVYNVHLSEDLNDKQFVAGMHLVRYAQPSGPYITVVSTAPASAKAVALAIQTAGWPEIKGVIAEDATIFLATATPGDQKVLLNRITHVLELFR